MLRRLLGRLDRRDIAPEEWLREGALRPLAVLILVLMPALLAGPVRAVLGLDINLAYIVGLLLTVAAALPFRPALTRKSRTTTHRPLALALALALVWAALSLLAAGSVVLLYNRNFGGLPGYQDDTGNVAIDGAVHALQSHLFLTSQPGLYEGFVALYSLWGALFHVVDQVTASNLSFHLGVAMVAIAPCVVVLSLRQGVAGLVAGFVAAVVIGWRLILPLEAFHFAGGFWAHLLALVPLVVMWWADVFVRERFLRIAALLALTALYRYTYGLNLADLLAALGGLLVLEAAARGMTRAGRVTAGALALALWVACRHAYTLLIPRLTATTGWIVPHDMAPVWRGQIAAVAAIALTLAWSSRLAEAKGSGIVRALRFPALFAVANALFVEAFKSEPNGAAAFAGMWSRYYFQKYSLHAVILVVCACAVLLAYWVGLAAAKPARRILLGGAAAFVLLLVSQHQLGEGLAPYQEVFAELRSDPPYKHLRPWVDVEGLRRMRSTLRTHGAQHGGFLAAYYPLAAFMNATFAHGELPFWNRQPVETTAGHCVFWEAGLVPALDGNPERSCESYEAPWLGLKRTMCARCF